MSPDTQRAIAAAAERFAREIVEAIRDQERPVDLGPDRLVDLRTAAAMLSIGRTRLYDEMDSGRLRSCRVGSRRLIPAVAIRDYLERAADR